MVRSADLAGTFCGDPDAPITVVDLLVVVRRQSTLKRPSSRPLPSPGITRLQRYYEPLRHPSAPGLSLTGVRLIIPDHAVGLPVLRALSLCTCCRHYPGAAAGRTPRSSHPAVSAFPDRACRVGLHIVLFEIP